MSEEKRILDMIAQGLITSEEGLELLKAIKTDEKPEVAVMSAVATKTRRQYNFLKIKVMSDEDNTKVNVNIPIKLVKALGGLAGNLNKYLPDDAKAAMQAQGVDISDLDIEAIMEALEEGAIEGPLVDVESNDNGKNTRVLVYVE